MTNSGFQISGHPVRTSECARSAVIEKPSIDENRRLTELLDVPYSIIPVVLVRFLTQPKLCQES